MSIQLITTIFNFLLFLVEAYTFGMIIYIFMSWLPGARESVVGRFMAKIYEPFLEPFRRIIPPLGFIDISPIVAFIVLNLFQRGLQSIFNLIINHFY
ncbi:cell division protein [Staphylococcus schleiferi]|uniref:Membrane protein n=1 Tax=Staphylococcus schleiferi TaxID=1295 RepID=A0A7Z7QQA5_STASC|nr:MULTISPECIES: YggT family protein [Staphylococcus]QGS47271.1 YggT family protein [Mammaliicoccus fleurettii]AKS67370.1 cell division protein [Staphylococcus schleiferi]AKS69512.1 cell division protein [Staphylococcus schleiferi]AKS71682.1 cell division protein [Staphylococcus schleiferi]AKS73917.1 cell division protein [Staphylococcus schleiferi]